MVNSGNGSPVVGGAPAPVYGLARAAVNVSELMHPRPTSTKHDRQTSSASVVPHDGSVSQHATGLHEIVLVIGLHPPGPPQGSLSQTSAGVHRRIGFTHGWSQLLAAHAIVITAPAGTSAAYRASVARHDGPPPLIGPSYVHSVSVQTAAVGVPQMQSVQWSY